MTWHACLFEAKSIQEYILRSGRLRHIVGASELVDGLTEGLLDDCLAALGLAEGEEGVQFSRRAGGAIYLFTPNAVQRDAFRDLWSLVVRQYAPGLSFALATGAGNTPYDAYSQARAQLDAQRNRPGPELPAGTPVTTYARRTGRPAVKQDSRLGLQDAATARFGLDTYWRSGNLPRKFAPDVTPENWPRELDYDPEGGDDERAFPFLRDNRYLGLLHADGNGLGQVLIKLADEVRARPELFLKLFRAFSDAVGRATETAAQRATETVLLGVATANGATPARPIVLGGDDLTILLRADLALPFTQVFLSEFEIASKEKMTELRARFPDVTGLPEALTAGAGIAFVKSSHPFHLAHELAESLANHAKQRAKKHTRGERIPPTVAFHRVTTSSHGNYDTILRDEMTLGAKDERISTTLEVYCTDPHPEGLPAFNDLQELAALLGAERMARGPARQVLTLLGHDVDGARRRYDRWREVTGDRNSKDLVRFDDLMRRLCGTLHNELPCSATGATPLGDVATLLAVSHGTDSDQSDREDAA